RSFKKMEDSLIKESLKYIRFLLLELGEFSPFSMGIDRNKNITITGTNDNNDTSQDVLEMLLDKSDKDLMSNVFEIVCVSADVYIIDESDKKENTVELMIITKDSIKEVFIRYFIDNNKVSFEENIWEK
ncbi:MAG: hypothetical protein PHV76_07165, partial [Bacteroidales bacterium]|nr:hypothetical protein [Bacteroidales bacterium]